MPWRPKKKAREPLFKSRKRNINNIMNKIYIYLICLYLHTLHTYIDILCICVSMSTSISIDICVYIYISTCSGYPGIHSVHNTGWPWAWTQISTCFCILSAGIKNVCHQHSVWLIQFSWHPTSSKEKKKILHLLI